jgi:hypothetical protein
MSDANDEDDELGVPDLEHDAVHAHANAPEPIQLTLERRSDVRVRRQVVDRTNEALAIARVDASQGFRLRITLRAKSDDVNRSHPGRDVADRREETTLPARCRAARRYRVPSVRLDRMQRPRLGREPMNAKRILTTPLRLGVAAAVASFVVDALRSEFFGSLQYFTYTGSLVIAVLLTLVVARRVDERHLVLALSIATVIHVVYIGLLVGPGGVVDDLRSGGLENLMLHYLTPYVLLVDLLALSEARRYRYRDAWAYLLVPVLYLGYVLVYGQLTREYPYFFLDVGELGTLVAAYVAAIAALFTGLNLALVAARKRLGRVRAEE